MGLAQKAIAYIEPEEYLRFEDQSKEKHEYMDGVIYAWQGTTVRGMAGTTLDHSRVCRNLTTLLHALTSAKHCEALGSEMRVRPDQNSAYFYPDVLVRCGAKLEGSTVEIDGACLIVEVLSPTTEGFDRQDKFERYKRMASLQTYVLVSPSLRTIEIFRRSQNWEANCANSRYEIGLFDLKLDPVVVFDGI